MTKRQLQLTIALLALVLTTACSGGLESPTSPTTASAVVPVQLTPVSTNALTSAVVVQGMPLNWEFGQGCVFQKPAFPATFAGIAPTETRVLANGNEVWALWQESEREDCKEFDSLIEEFTIREYTVASFVSQGGEWRYCQWAPMTWEKKVTRLKRFSSETCPKK